MRKKFKCQVEGCDYVGHRTQDIGRHMSLGHGAKKSASGEWLIHGNAPAKLIPAKRKITVDIGDLTATGRIAKIKAKFYSKKPLGNNIFDVIESVTRKLEGATIRDIIDIRTHPEFQEALKRLHTASTVALEVVANPRYGEPVYTVSE